MMIKSNAVVMDRFICTFIFLASTVKRKLPVQIQIISLVGVTPSLHKISFVGYNLSTAQRYSMRTILRALQASNKRAQLSFQ